MNFKELKKLKMQSGTTLLEKCVQYLSRKSQH